MLTGAFDQEIYSIVFGGRLIALSKKDGGIRPICVGYTLRRLAAKCANSHVISRRSKALQPQQLGVGVSDGAEAAVHAARMLVSTLPSGHVVVKLDFSNAFNYFRRDLILDSVAANIPEIYRLVYSTYSCEPVLSFKAHEVLSSDGEQQGDPQGSLEFCEEIHPLLLKLRSAAKIGFMDDITLSGDLHTVKKDVLTMIESCSETGLRLNTDKCEIIMKDFTEIDKLSTFKDFIHVTKEDMTLLGSPVVKAKHRMKPLRTRLMTLPEQSHAQHIFRPMMLW